MHKCPGQDIEEGERQNWTLNRLTRRNTETEVFTDEVEITQKEGVKKMKGERGKKNVEE